MFLSEDGFEVVRVDYGVASIPFFRIDVLSFSESIWFCAKTTRAEPDNKIELEEVLVVATTRHSRTNDLTTSKALSRLSSNEWGLQENLTRSPRCIAPLFI